jgi:nucleoside-diphosphate-sugar epimerase
VISTLGVPYTKEQVTTFSQGTRNIAEAMSRHGLRRLVCVSSIGVHTDIPPQMTFLFRRIVGPTLLAMGRSVYDDARCMEQIVRATDLAWTIVRPSGLFDTAAVSDYTVTVAPHRVTGMFTSRADLADLLLREAVDDRHVHACIEVITTQGTPNYLKVFLREALHIGG